MSFFKKLFNKNIKKREEALLTDEILISIRNQSPRKIEDLVQKIKDRPSFINSHYKTLLSAAVATDNLAVFDAVFKINPDPNYMFQEGYSALFVFYNYETPLLNYAIRQGAKNIALSLIKNPDLDVTLREREESLKLPLSQEEKPPTALEIASQIPGMEKVVIALATRALHKNPIFPASRTSK